MWKQGMKFRHLGYHEKIMPVVEKAMADFLLRISVNSSYVVLAAYDITAEGFYEHSITDFFDQIPDNLSFPTEFSPYLKPYVSDNFGRLVYSDMHELLIGSFYGYYSVRLPALIHHGRFADWPKIVGVSEDNLRRISSYSLTHFENYFPAAAQKLIADGPDDPKSIFREYATGEHFAHKYKLDDQKMKRFLYEFDPLWEDIVEYFEKIKEHWNIFSFLRTLLSEEFNRFWDSYYADYMDTLRHWSTAGGFQGDTSDLFEGFWEDLERRLNRNEFIL
jgi:hypothetical protein